MVPCGIGTARSDEGLRVHLVGRDYLRYEDDRAGSLNVYGEDGSSGLIVYVGETNRWEPYGDAVTFMELVEVRRNHSRRVASARHRLRVSTVVDCRGEPREIAKNR